MTKADTLAGNGTSGFADGIGREAMFNGPRGIAVGIDGTLFVVDRNNCRIRQIDPVSREVITIAGNGEIGVAEDGTRADLAPFNGPYDIVVGPDGSVYVADTANHRVAQLYQIRSVWYVRNYAGVPEEAGDSGDGGPASEARFTDVVGLGIDSTGTLYVTDHAMNRVRQILPDGTIGPYAGDGVTSEYTGDGGDPLLAGLSLPSDVAVDELSGTVYIVDTGHHVIRAVREEGDTSIISTVVGTGACYIDGDRGLASLASLCNPHSIAVDGQGGLFIAESANNRIRHAYFEASR
jgi:sugar lactone lactonase YvrE